MFAEGTVGTEMATCNTVHSGSVCLSDPSSTRFLQVFSFSFSFDSKDAFAINLAMC